MNVQRNSLILLVAIMGAVMAAPYEEPEVVPAPRSNSSAVQQPVVRLAARPPPAVAPVNPVVASPKESSAIAVQPAAASSEEAPPEEATIEDLSDEGSIPEPFPVAEPAVPAARNNSKTETDSQKVKVQRTPVIEKKEDKEAEEKADVVKPTRGSVGAEKDEAAPEKPAQKLKKEEKDDQDADAKELFKREVENFNF